MKRKPQLAPRNPLVAPALFRKTGKHGKTRKAERRTEQMETANLFKQSTRRSDTRSMSSTRGSCPGVSQPPALACLFASPINTVL